MKKYRLLKDLPWYNRWIIVNIENNLHKYMTFEEVIKCYLDNDDWFEEVVEDKQPTKEEIEFLNKNVERFIDILFIQWDKKELISNFDWKIIINNKIKSHNQFKLSFTICNLSDLKEWDVFYIRWDEFIYKNINIFIWIDNEQNYITNYLNNNDSVEYIDSNFEWDVDVEVIKINRE